MSDCQFFNQKKTPHTTIILLHEKIMCKGGDPAAGSPTATLLRLRPPQRTQIRAQPTKIGASSKPFLGGVTGGVCKEQGRIHRAVMTRDYYAFQLHEGELQPSIRTKTRFRRLPPPFGVGTHCPSHCSPRVAQGIRGIRTYRRPLLPPVYHWRSP